MPEPWVTVRLQRGVFRPELKREHGLTLELRIANKLETHFKTLSRARTKECAMHAVLTPLAGTKWYLYHSQVRGDDNGYSFREPVNFLEDRYEAPTLAILETVGASKGITFAVAGAFSEDMLRRQLRNFGDAVQHYIKQSFAPIDINLRVE